MKNALLFVIASLLLTAIGAAATDTQTLEGEYYSGAERGDLEAHFTPAGEDRWDVDFHFTFQGRADVFSGTAEGNLVDGDLEGTVYPESRQRTFTFRGSFQDGAFHGTHAEIEDDAEQETGTMTLRHESSADSQ